MIKIIGTYLVIVVQGDVLEVLQLAQIPELDDGIVGRGGQVVTVLGEGKGGDRAGMSGEISHVGAFLEIPNLDDAVGRSRPEDQTVGVELGTCEG